MDESREWLTLYVVLRLLNQRRGDFTTGRANGAVHTSDHALVNSFVAEARDVRRIALQICDVLLAKRDFLGQSSVSR